MAKAEESSRFVSVGCSLDEFVQHQENKNIVSKSQRHVSLLKKILVWRKQLRETENIGARDLDMLIANFLLQAREFLFKVVLRKLLQWKFSSYVLWRALAIESACSGCIHELFVSKALTRSYLARSGFHTINSYSWTQTRTPHFLWR